MASTRAATRSALPRFVLFWSALDAAKQGTKTTTSRMVLGAAFSREHFPKTLAATCLLSFGIGFSGMNRLQRNRQLRWEQQQEEAEIYHYNRKIASQDQSLRVSTTTTTTTIPTIAESVKA